MSETWILNESLSSTKLSKTQVNFISNGYIYEYIEHGGGVASPYLEYYTDAETYTDVYTTDSPNFPTSFWIDQAYRTITFDQPVTDTTLLTWLQSNGIKQSASSPTFKHFFNSGTIGSGTIKFRHFSQTGPLPQLATPQNVAVNGTTLSWDAVENATSYDIYADGTFIGNKEVKEYEAAITEVVL